MPVLVLYLVNPSLLDFIIVRSAYCQPVLEPQMLRHFGNVRPISIYWYSQIHVYIHLVKHICCEIGVGLKSIRVVDDSIEIVLKSRVEF